MSSTTQLQVSLVLDEISRLLTERRTGAPHTFHLFCLLLHTQGQEQALKEAQGTKHCSILLPSISTNQLQFGLELGLQT